MTALATRSQHPTAELPAHSQALLEALSRRAPSVWPADPAYGHETGLVLGAVPATPTPEVVAEARRALGAYVTLQRPSSDVIRAWLLALNAAVVNSLSQPAFDTRMASLLPELLKFAARAFCQASLSEAKHSFNLWPGPKDLLALLHRHDRELRDTERRLRELAEWRGSAEAAWTPPGEREVEAVDHMLAAWRHERALRRLEEIDPRPPLPDVSLTPRELVLAHGAHPGSPLHAARAAHLAEQLRAEIQEPRA